jgi:hypothetical protein
VLYHFFAKDYINIIHLHNSHIDDFKTACADVAGSGANRRKISSATDSGRC